MISLALSFAVLIAGYLVYGQIVEKVFAPDGRKTPAYTKEDGVDFMPMPTWKAFLVQLLNIAGTGPIFGALMGACFGPVVFLWIIFGAVLIIMAVGILGGIVAGGYTVPEITLRNLHPEGLPVWPFMFVTVACGAISGFHATQSPMVAKFIKSEKLGRKVFYGAMLSESIIALAWAAGGVAFYGAAGGLNNALTELGQSGTVYDISTGMLGPVGGVLAIVGVIACPITSGDTAFRSARLILAEITKLDQKNIRNRLLITLPLLAVGAVLTQLDFNVLWRYFSWSNQTLAMISLWVATAYLVKKHRNKLASLITALPATFMSAVSMTYILMADEGFRLGAGIGYPAGIAFAAILFFIYVIAVCKSNDEKRL